MSQAPLIDDQALGYEQPRNIQFSVFLDNRVGKLLELVQVFEGHALAIAGLSVIDSADHAVVRLITSRSDLARRLLTRHKLPFSEKEVLVVELTRNHTMATMCLALLGAELNIHYAYPLLVRPHDLPTIALQCDDHTLACQILLRKRFTLLGENDLGENATNSDAATPQEE